MTLLALMRCGVAAFLVFLVTRTWADPDLWGHLQFGRDILQSWALATTDPYSFTSDKPWVNHEWLSEVLMYLAYESGGNFGLIALKTSLMLAALAAVVVVLRAADLDPGIHDLLIFLIVAASFGRAHVLRPQVFSIALFAALLLAISMAERGRRGALPTIPLILVAWVNLHGGWIVGLGVFLFWVAFRPIALWRPHGGRDDRAWLLGTAGLSVAATLLNPYGWRLWLFLSETVRFERTAISDWQPIWSLPPIGLAPWLATTAFVTVTIITRFRHINVRLALVPVCCGIASVFVGRLDIFFAFSAVMLLGPSLGAAQGEVPFKKELAALGLVSALTLAVVGMQPRMACVIMDGTWQPEAEVVHLLRNRGLTGRMLTFFDWGEYAIWHLAPAIRVSFDGRRETVYSDRVIEDHLTVYANHTGADIAVSAMKPDFVWLPTTFGVLGELEKTGWIPLFRGPLSTLLARGTGGSAQDAALPVSSAREARCFPGP